MRCYACRMSHLILVFSFKSQHRAALVDHSYKSLTRIKINCFVKKALGVFHHINPNKRLILELIKSFATIIDSYSYYLFYFIVIISHAQRRSTLLNRQFVLPSSVSCKKASRIATEWTCYESLTKGFTEKMTYFNRVCNIATHCICRLRRNLRSSV